MNKIIVYLNSQSFDADAISRAQYILFVFTRFL
jgi:hypothetical protein